MKLSLGFVCACITALFSVSSVSGQPYSEQVLYGFPSDTDGYYPMGALVAGQGDSFYGTTLEGGTEDLGTVFELTKSAGGTWVKTTIHEFQGSDGASPWCTLIKGAKGVLYGTTQLGGMFGYGTAFRLTPSAGKWMFTVLYSFGNLPDAEEPVAGVIEDAAGNLYGVTTEGGDRSVGTIFELSPPGGASGSAQKPWTEKVLYSFSGGADGATPLAALTSDAKGELYGVASRGGSGSGQGTVFSLTPPAAGTDGSWTEATLYQFNGQDGSSPWGKLLVTGGGALVGTTRIADPPHNFGLVFALVPPSQAGGKWTESVLHYFEGTDGSEPQSGLLAGKGGKLYGTTTFGGPAACGVVYSLTPPSTNGGSWTESVLYGLAGGADACTPTAGLIEDQNGDLFSTSEVGGLAQLGTVFEVSPE